MKVITADRQVKTSNTTKQKFVNCVICGADSTELIANVCRYNVVANNVICKKCGFVYINPRLTPEELKGYYEKEYRLQYKVVNLNSYKHLLFKKVKAQLLSGYIKDKAKILEIGCANGVLLNEIRKLKPSVELFGVEPTSSFIQGLRRNKVQVFQGVFENFKSSAKKFDFVILDHVLEHFDNPLAIMKKIAYVLKDDGFVFIEVPDIWQPYGDLELNFFQHVHLCSFSENTLENLVNLAGFYPFYKFTNYALGFIVKKTQAIKKADIKIDNYSNLIQFLKIYKNHYRLLSEIFTKKQDLFNGPNVNINNSAQNKFLHCYTKMLSRDFISCSKVSTHNTDNVFDVNSKSILSTMLKILKDKQVIN